MRWSREAVIHRQYRRRPCWNLTRTASYLPLLSHLFHVWSLSTSVPIVSAPPQASFASETSSPAKLISMHDGFRSTLIFPKLMSCEMSTVHYFTNYTSLCWPKTRHFQVIICGCWIFSLVLNLPLFLVTTFDESLGNCEWNWPKRWMGAAYDTTWLVLLALIPLIVMTGLYSRVIYTLWFKRNDDNELAFQQKVGTIRKKIAI